MARTKGSKGKKTLAKEMGMTLEEYNQYLIEKGTVKCKVTKIVKDTYGGYLGNDKLLEAMDLPTGDVDEEKDKSDKLINEEKLEILSNLPLKTEEEIEKDSLTLFPFDKVDVDELIEKKKNKKSKELVECARCHQTILGAPPSKINLTYITTQASYHRQVSEDRPLLCWNCLNKLNKLIDNFLLDDGSGIPPKFKIN